MGLLLVSLSFAHAKPLLLDVRTQAEWNEKNIPEALLIDFQSPNFRERVNELDKNESYWVFCRSGVRAGKAVKVMKELGFRDVENIGSIEEAEEKLAD